MIPLASLAMTVMQSPDGGTPISPEINTITFDYDSCGNHVWRQGKYIIVVDPGLEPPGGVVLFQGGIGGRSIDVTAGESGGFIRVSFGTWDDSDRCRMSVYSVNGVLVTAEDAVSASTDLDVSSSPRGCYILHVLLNDESAGLKFMKTSDE